MHPLYDGDQWRPLFRVGQGRQDRSHHPDRIHASGRGVVEHRGARPRLHAAAKSEPCRPCAELEIDGLFARPAALSDEAGRFRSQRASAIRRIAASPDYVRISWDEALDIVSGEITRSRRIVRAERDHLQSSSRITAGAISAITVSALLRFANLVGHTRIADNPDSWEGWYWGAVHHWGHSMRFGLAEPLRHHRGSARRTPSWSSSGRAIRKRPAACYAGHEGTRPPAVAQGARHRRVHIDPYLNHTAAFLGGTWIAPRPGTDTALALAIAMCGSRRICTTRNSSRSARTGFDAWRATSSARTTASPKRRNGRRSKPACPRGAVRALARQWGSKRTYLARRRLGSRLGAAPAAARPALQWARAMVCLIAMQGLGRPGRQFRQPAMGHAGRS